MLTVWLVSLTATVLACLLLSWLRRTSGYWLRRGVPHLKPVPFFGNFLQLFALRKTSVQIYTQLYDEFPEARAVGLYEFTNPVLLVKDPDLIEQVLIRDFNSYPDHGPFIFERSSGLHNGLFNLYGERWRALRNKLLSTFTTGRLREMYPGLAECCRELIASRPTHLDRQAVSKLAVDSFMRGLFGCRLRGGEGEAELREAVSYMFEAPLHRYIQQQILTYFPRFGELLNLKYMSSGRDNYFRSIVNTILDQRKQLGTERKDFADILLQIRDFKTLNIFNRENNKTEEIFDVTNELVLSQGFMFFFAGMDTTSLVMLYTAFELACSPEAQERARSEVAGLADKHGGLTFDAVREMKYMEQCIQEALRLHPSLTFLMRVTDRPTRLGDIELDKGIRIIIPNFNLQLDPKYFPDPLKFDPDRFHESSPRNKFAHLPFSDGPRVCVGKKFSIVEISTLMAHLLQKYELSLDPRTKLPLEYVPRKVFLTPVNPVIIKLTEIGKPE